MNSPRFFAFLGPGRRASRRVIEVQLDTSERDPFTGPRDALAVASILEKAGILAPGTRFPGGDLPASPTGRFVSLLADVALLIQQVAGHPVESVTVFDEPDHQRWVALLDYEHPDVGLTAVKMAAMLMQGHLDDLVTPFADFRAFARDRALPAETRAIISAAEQRGIPWQLPEQLPLKPYLQAPAKRRPNSLLWLGQGASGLRIEGGHAEDRPDTASLGEHLEQLADRGAAPDRLAKVAAGLLDAWFPPPDNGRIPVTVITGTNGKTTTTRLVRYGLSLAGRQVAMTCTEGLYLGDETLDDGDQAALSGHARALALPNVDCAVLEAHHSNLLVYGLTHTHCDVGICLNVTDDHIGIDGVDSVAQMAALKRSVPAHADGMAILNADDRHCQDMLQHCHAERIGLVSLDQERNAVQSLATMHQVSDERLVMVLLQEGDAGDQLVLHTGQHTEVLARVCDIPCAFGGAARFNLSNAAHAALALHAQGLDAAQIGRALTGFKPGQAMTPGRMNQFDALPFKVVMDFAHNPDGMRQVADFARRMPVSGRRLVAFSGTFDRTEATYRALSQALVGHFDHYFCKEYVSPPGYPELNVAPILHDELLRLGVSPENVSLMRNGRDVIFEIFDACQEGDLLVMLLGYVEIHQLAGYIEDYALRLKER